MNKFWKYVCFENCVENFNFNFRMLKKKKLWKIIYDLLKGNENKMEFIGIFLYVYLCFILKICGLVMRFIND